MNQHCTPSNITGLRIIGGAAILTVVGVLGACQGGGNATAEGGDGTTAPAAVRIGSNRPIPTVLESGENAMRARDYEKARAEFAEVVERDPGEPKARHLLGLALLELGKPAEAREQMEVGLAADVDNEEIYAGLCRALYEDNKLDELFRLLRQRTTEHGSVADYLVLAEYSRKAGDVDEAHNALLTAARLDKGRHIVPQVALADFYQSINNPSEASRRLRMAYFIDNSNAEVNRRLVEFGHRLAPGLGLMPLERQ